METLDDTIEIVPVEKNTNSERIRRVLQSHSITSLSRHVQVQTLTTNFDALKTAIRNNGLNLLGPAQSMWHCNHHIRILLQKITIFAGFNECRPVYSHSVDVLCLCIAGKIRTLLLTGPSQTGLSFKKRKKDMSK